MKRAIAAAGLSAVLLGTTAAWAGIQTVTLSVEGMSCASCPYIVKRTLAQVPGVTDVDVSFETKTARVTYDDTKATAAALTAATQSMGFPSRVLDQGG